MNISKKNILFIVIIIILIFVSWTIFIQKRALQDELADENPQIQACEEAGGEWVECPGMMNLSFPGSNAKQQVCTPPGCIYENSS